MPAVTRTAARHRTAVENLRLIRERVAGMQGRLGIVPVPHFLKFFFVDDCLFHRLQFDGADSDDFEVRATLGAGNDFAFVDFFFVDIEISFAFWTINHDRPPGLDGCSKSAPANI